MKYAVEMGSDAIIYTPSFIKTGLGIQKLMVGGRIHRQHGVRIGLLAYFYFFKIKKRRQKTGNETWGNIIATKAGHEFE
jgi:hypothetical protein